MGTEKVAIEVGVCKVVTSREREGAQPMGDPPITDYKVTAGHWPFSENFSKVATQNLDQLGLNCMDGLPNLFCTLHSVTRTCRSR